MKLYSMTVFKYDVKFSSIVCIINKVFGTLKDD